MYAPVARDAARSALRAAWPEEGGWKTYAPYSTLKYSDPDLSMAPTQRASACLEAATRLPTQARRLWPFVVLACAYSMFALSLTVLIVVSRELSCMYVCMYDYILVAVSTRTLTPPTTGAD